MTYSSTLTAHYLALAKLPINEGDFAGSDVRYSNEYPRLAGASNRFLIPENLEWAAAAWTESY